MSTDLNTAFQTGSGIDPAKLKTLIVTTTAAGLVLICIWIIHRLHEAFQKEEIDKGELIKEMVFLAVPLVFMLVFMTRY